MRDIDFLLLRSPTFGYIRLPMNWEKLDWPYLQRLRALYLKADPSKGNYFKNSNEIASYDLTFAQRISWKWQSVMDELKLRAINFPLKSIWDWGCGSGIASRVFLQSATQVEQVYLWDQSSVAREFARKKICEQNPNLKVSTEEPVQSLAEGILISHVLNELNASQLQGLKKNLQKLDFVLWVENGTLLTSQALGKLRNEFLSSQKWRILGPCTHQQICPLGTEVSTQDWCHSFAKVPSQVHQNADWRKFSTTMSIDLRSVPYSYLCMVKRDSHLEEKMLSDSRSLEQDLHRKIGSPRHYKGYSKILDCHGQLGVREINVSHRNSPDFVKLLKKEKNRSPFFRAELKGGELTTGDWL